MLSTNRQSAQPSERDRGILHDIIRAFILTGEPVSSGSVARMERHGLSAASIRNIMAELEDRGGWTGHSCQ